MPIYYKSDLCIRRGLYTYLRVYSIYIYIMIHLYGAMVAHTVYCVYVFRTSFRRIVEIRFTGNDFWRCAVPTRVGTVVVMRVKNAHTQTHHDDARASSSTRIIHISPR